MILEPCPVCGSTVWLYNRKESSLARVHCWNKECLYSGPVYDIDGSKHNKLSLYTRLGQMHREFKLEVYEVGHKHDWAWEARDYLRTYKSCGLLTSFEDAIRDAWRTLREGK